MVDTSSKAQAYFGDSNTESLALFGFGKMHPRGVQVKNFLLTGVAAFLILPTVELIASGTRLVIVNDPSSLGPLTVGNGGGIIVQQFDIPVGELAEVWFITSETEFTALPAAPHFGAGFPPSRAGAGVWTWDIQTYTAKLALG